MCSSLCPLKTSLAASAGLTSTGTRVVEGTSSRTVPAALPPTRVTRFWQSSNAQCEQCNHTHSENQHCKCYRIVVQPMQPLLHGTPPVPDQLWVSDSATERTSAAALGSAVQKGRHPSGSVQAAGNQRKNPPLGPCALRTRRLILRRGSFCVE
jgi:hypothetical protein